VEEQLKQICVCGVLEPFNSKHQVQETNQEEKLICSKQINKTLNGMTVVFVRPASSKGRLQSVRNAVVECSEALMLSNMLLRAVERKSSQTCVADHKQIHGEFREEPPADLLTEEVSITDRCRSGLLQGVF